MVLLVIIMTKITIHVKTLFLQVTFVGLYALSKYSAYVAGEAIDVNVIITPPGVTFHVDSTNKQVLQTSPIDVPTNISINVSGEGCALVQVFEHSLLER